MNPEPSPAPATSSNGSSAVPVEVTNNAAIVGNHPRPAAPNSAPISPTPAHSRSKYRAIRVVVGLAVASGLAWIAVPWLILSLNTVSTDDAYVDGHVTFVAPRVSGQVSRVLVDDNMRVKKGEVLVLIDPEPFQAQVAIDESLVKVAEADVVNARSQVESNVAKARSARFNLEHAIETVRDQVALLKSNLAHLKVEQATLIQAERDFDRNAALVEKKVITLAEFDLYKARRDEARSRVESASQVVQQTRVGLGLPINTENPLDVPDDLEQTFSLVRQALANMVQAVSQVGYTPKSWNQSPKEAVEDFYKQDSDGNLDRIYSRLISTAPLLKQAEAKLQQAKRNLELSQLNLRYCTVVSEIGGVVTRRNVNPGNFVQNGQSLMAVRSLDEIWVAANFKETQLADLRIGQRVRLEVDMYGHRQEFEGRISGFTMGTGQTLALLPPQNATGNYIKIVQRLPVRIEFTDYDPEKAPLFVGLSVVPYVYFKEPATGPNAGKILQRLMTTTASAAVGNTRSTTESQVDNR